MNIRNRTSHRIRDGERNKIRVKERRVSERQVKTSNKQKTLICCFACLSIPSSFVFLFLIKKKSPFKNNYPTRISDQTDNEKERKKREKGIKE